LPGKKKNQIFYTKMLLTLITNIYSYAKQEGLFVKFATTTKYFFLGTSDLLRDVWTVGHVIIKSVTIQGKYRCVLGVLGLWLCLKEQKLKTIRILLYNLKQW